jgi:hypothetical protein
MLDTIIVICLTSNIHITTYEVVKLIVQLS